MQSASAQTAWTWRNPLPHGNTLRDVEFVDPSTGIIVGDVGTIMRTIDGGETWSLIDADTKADLYGVSFPDPDTGFIAGNKFLRTIDGGKTWTILEGGAGSRISFPNTKIGYTTASWSGDLEYPPTGIFARTRNGGQSWERQRIGYSISDNFFITESIGTIIADGCATHRTVNGGDQWRRTIVSKEPSTYLNALFFTAIDTGCAVGKNGEIFRTTDGGLTWMKISSPTTEHLQAVFFFNAELGASVGNNGTILRTVDGGITWRQGVSGTTLDLLNVWFTEALNGVAVGTGGIILRTDDGGITWKNLLLAASSLHLFDVGFANDKIGAAIGKGGTILRTSNGGNNWLPQQSGTLHDLFDVAFIQHDIGLAVGQNGVILRTNDAGATWATQLSNTSNNLYDVWLNDGNIVSAVGDSGVILRTFNGGMSWERQISGTTSRLLCVSFSGLDTGIVVSQLGEILHTDNAGDSWINLTSAPVNRVQTVHFIDADTGIIANGWIGNYGVPYIGVWITTNGGETWERSIFVSTYLAFPKAVLWHSSFGGLVVGDKGMLMRKDSFEANWRFDTRGTINDLYGVAFIDSNRIVVVGEYGTIMQARSDGVVSVREHDLLENVSPREPALLQNYPNPFNPSTTIEFFLPHASLVSLRIFNTLGQEVAVLISQFRAQGRQSVIWQTKDLAGGIYLCRLETKDGVQSKKLLLLR